MDQDISGLTSSEFSMLGLEKSGCIDERALNFASIDGQMKLCTREIPKQHNTLIFLNGEKFDRCWHSQ